MLSESKKGAPVDMAREMQVQYALVDRLADYIVTLREVEYANESDKAATRVTRQPVGVCALITPWNWALSQVGHKVFPALGVGCTVVLKPSIYAPLDAIILAECIDEAGFAPGVFNLIQGSAASVGEHLAGHPDVNLLSLTGSVHAGTAASRVAADTVKRVTLELGGKSPNIVFADADLKNAAKWQVQTMALNTGQNCNAPSRMLVEGSVYDQIVELVSSELSNVCIDDPSKPGNHIGPLVNQAQYDRVQHYIGTGIDEGATLISGGLGKPEGFSTGYFVKPTVFANVTNDMTIAREEIFGPVFGIIPFESEEEAIEIANDTEYGLAGYVFTQDIEKAERVARAIDAGMISINGLGQGIGAPNGGFNRSGLGREGGLLGVEEFLEVKTISG